MPAKWSRVAPYIEQGFALSGRVERTEIIDRAYDDAADDDIVDAIDALGSRVFNTVDDAKRFLVTQGAVEE
jgi:hypothetical protein